MRAMAHRENSSLEKIRPADKWALLVSGTERKKTRARIRAGPILMLGWRRGLLGLPELAREGREKKMGWAGFGHGLKRRLTRPERAGNKRGGEGSWAGPKGSLGSKGGWLGLFQR